MSKQRITIKLKQSLPNGGEFKIVNCYLDKNTGEIVDCEDALGIEAEYLDDKTKRAFGNKDMIVWQKDDNL